MECVAFLEMPSPGITMTTDQDEDVNDVRSFPPPLALGCYAYLLLAEKLGTRMEVMVYSHSFFFHIALKFCKVLLERKKNIIIKKGLKLLEELLSRLPDHTLQQYMLEDKLYMRVAQVLVNVMTLCQRKKFRQDAVKYFGIFIQKFDSSGRHKFYHQLLRTISHPGVRGFLIHSIKEEVAKALNDENSGGDKFLGSSLLVLLDVFMTVGPGVELMKELDWIMSSLNLFRYLLLRDKKEINTSGIWDNVAGISHDFLHPLRNLLTSTQAHCRNETKIKQQELQAAKVDSGRGIHQDDGEKKEDKPKMSVQMLDGEVLPEPSLKDQIEMLAVSGHHLDMLESVLVRVEELVT